MRRRDEELEMAEMVVQQTYEESAGELSSKNPMVLSCGGMYIPHEKRKGADMPLWEVISTPDSENPSKVVSSGMPKSPLAAILDKEHLN